MSPGERQSVKGWASEGERREKVELAVMMEYTSIKERKDAAFASLADGKRKSLEMTQK